MARTKAVLGAGARLSDYLSASLLARVYPVELVHQVLDEGGVNSQRVRSFPAVAATYYCMALSLYPEAAYEDVFAVVAQGLAWMQASQAVPTLAKSSISAARTKIGCAPLQALQARVCVPLANAKAQPHAFYAGLRLVAIDGSNFEVPDEAANAAAFGYPGSRTGHAAYPQAQCAVLIECATHVILGANLGPYRMAEWEICKPLLARLAPGMLCLADRGFSGYEHWRAASDTGAQLLWRCVANRQLPLVKALDDGSYLSVIYPNPKSRRKRRGEITVRVIEYALPGVPDAQVRYRLLTTLLDPAQAPALELATLYHERWEVEAVFDELKTHLVQRRRTLRSKTPEGVRQEFYGWVLTHYAVCWLMHQAASAHRLRQRSLSFTGHVQLLRRAQPRSGAFPPSAPKTASTLVRTVAARGRRTAKHQ
jgi:Insertion element 4 transposase N-terminal/Transposase DDE domain